MREKCKDIVALLSDDNLLAESRRNRQPPHNRRPSEVDPLTISKGDGPLQSTASSRRDSHQSAGRSSRKSFEDLQSIDEDAAMQLALDQSKAEYESLQLASRSKYTVGKHPLYLSVYL